MDLKKLGKPSFRDGTKIGWVTGGRLIEKNLYSGEVRIRDRRKHHRQGRAL